MPVNSPPPEGVRLQKVMAHAGVASRRKCEEYITAGRVTVNGKKVTELGTRIDPDNDRVAIDGKELLIVERPKIYYLLYKPVGYVSTVSDPQGRPTALSLVPTDERLYPVGRLDMDSEGLMLFTNDGTLAHHLMHPRFENEKEYRVLVRGELRDEDFERMRAGIQIDEDGVVGHAVVSRQRPRWSWRGERLPAGHTWYGVTLHEGRKRQIRLMFQALGHNVERLIRVRLATLELTGLTPGQGRWLGDREARELRRFIGVLSGPKTGPKTMRKRSSGKDHDRDRRPGGVRQKHSGRAPRR
ncbi:MAG: pseudouridine synthase [Anaerolineae bacterium]